MGQAASAQRLVERDFAGRLVFSHGLFHSLHCGSYALCQVDLTGEAPAKPRNDIGTEVVVQIIVLNEEGKSGSANFGKDKGKLSGITEHDDEHGTVNGGVSEPIAESENTTSKVQYQKAPSFEEWGKNNRREKELGNGAVSDDGNDKIVVKCEKSPSFEEWQITTQRPSLAEHQVTELMSKLAPSVVIAPVSVDQLLSDIHKFKAENFSNESKHPNLVPVLGAYKGDGVLYIVFPKAPFSVESILHFSPSAFGSDDHIRLLLFEILAGLAHCHNLGIYHGNLRPWNFLVINPTWCWLTGFGKQQEEIRFDYLLAEARVSDWTGVFKRWWAGEVSNYDYLLLLNKLAGRRWGDECFHTVMPWVIDFSVKPDTSSSKGWRDLTRSKWRLAKGDEQLDFTYANAEIPHHVSDECLSELAVCNYKARRLPLLLLRRIVRSVYEPNEYPSSMQRLYQWTPDECIPEFYSDPDVFTSIHAGMSDLAVPHWSRSAEEFIQVHRAALESDRVSQQLHHWIDLTFGYKLSGQAAVDAKNVTLSSSSSAARCSGRRQLFSVPHPRRRQQQVTKTEPIRNGGLSTKSELVMEPDAVDFYSSSVVGGDLERASHHLKQVAPLEDLKEASFFAEKARHLSSCYAPRASSEGVTKKEGCEAPKESSFFAEKCRHLSSCYAPKVKSGGVTHNLSLGIPKKEECASCLEASSLHKVHLLASIHGKDAFRLAEEVREVGDSALEDLVWWEALRQQQQQQGALCSEAEGGDVFAVACVVAEVYLRRPLFDPVSMAAFEESGALPEIMNQLPPFVVALIKPALHPDFHHRPSVEMLIKSPFFSPRIRAVYSFLATLHSLQSGRERLQFAADMAMLNAFQKLGAVATEMVAPSCLALVVPFASSIDPAAVMCLLKDLLRALKPHVAQQLVVPVVEHLLQSQETSALQLALVQPPFLEDVYKTLGTAAYLSHLHPLILSNLRRSPAGRLEKACGTVLLSMCQHLGLPITLNQTLTPIMLSFGRDISVAGIDALVAIGERLGERVVVKHILPAARFIVSMGLQLSSHSKVTPSHSLRLLAMVDAMAVLDRIISLIPTSTILSELLQDPNNVYVKILLQPELTQNLLQCAAKALLLACQRVGAEVTAALVLLQLKPFFDEVAFAYEHSLEHSKRTGNSSASVPAADATSVEDDSTSSERVGIVYILYPGFASLLGIEKLRQSLSTWLLLEQALLKHFNWKWAGSTSDRPKFTDPRKADSHPNLPYDCNPANLLIDGVRWSIPQSKTPSTTIRTPDSPPDHQESPSTTTDEPWTWVPPLVDTLESSSSSSSSREQAWKLSAVILHSVRVHSGAMRAAAVGEDEGTVFTAGGSGSDAVVRQWKLASSECCMEYAGHQEAVIAICLLPGNRVASCDGTLHIWSPHTGAQLAVFDESSASTASTMITNLMSSSFETGRLPVRKSVDGASSSSIGGHVYTCLHSMEVEEKIVTGTVNGSLRFFDTVEGRRLFLWRCDLGESYMSSYVSALASCGQRACNDLGTKCVAAGYSSGHCRVLDYRSGRVVMNWRAHDASVTKLDVLDGNHLVSSSTDKTLRLWDLRRSAPTQLQTFKGHLDGVVSFALRGTDMLSAAGNKIGLSSLSKSPQAGQETQVIQPQRLYTAHQQSRSFSRIISISVLPFSRLFLIGTEDGFLKVCS